jgi:hypothetical protein
MLRVTEQLHSSNVSKIDPDEAVNVAARLGRQCKHTIRAAISEPHVCIVVMILRVKETLGFVWLKLTMPWNVECCAATTAYQASGCGVDWVGCNQGPARANVYANEQV